MNERMNVANETTVSQYYFLKIRRSAYEDIKTTIRTHWIIAIKTALIPKKNEHEWQAIKSDLLIPLQLPLCRI